MTDSNKQQQQQPSKEPPRKPPVPPPESKDTSRTAEFGEHQAKDGITIEFKQP